MGQNPSLGQKPQCYFHSQQVPLKQMEMEEEGDSDEELRSMKNPQIVSIYMKEIFTYIRKIEVLY